MNLITEIDPSVAALRSKLDAYYANARDYTAFIQPSSVGYFWCKITPVIDAVVRRRGKCRLLEFGAGRSGLGRFLAETGLRQEVHLTLHDVVDANLAWLRAQADEVTISPVPEIVGEYDIILSSFVVEHMTDPRRSMAALWRALAPGGALFIVCPCYDWPFYLPPSCDHLTVLERSRLAMKVMTARARTIFSGRPAFLLLSDPALFYLPYQTDRDAIHLASWFDLSHDFRERKARVTRLRFRWIQHWWEAFSLGGFRAWFISRLGLLGLQVEKPL